ncbi:MAG: hypothetical protein ACRDGT_00365 [Candidatus Limnocylindria bacterium]
MSARGHRQIAQVLGIRGQDLVAIFGQDDKRGIDHVGAASSAQQDARPKAEISVEGTDVEAG